MTGIVEHLKRALAIHSGGKRRLYTAVGKRDLWDAYEKGFRAAMESAERWTMNREKKPA